MKNTILSILTGVALLGGAIAAQAQAQVIGGYPVFNGSFQQQGPVPTGLTNNVSPVLVQQGDLIVTGKAIIQGGTTNSGALSRVANPIVTGATNYTCPAAQGFLTLNLLSTNAAILMISNVNSGEIILSGNNIATIGTNYASVTLRVGPSEVIAVTNLANAAGYTTITGSEWRN